MPLWHPCSTIVGWGWGWGAWRHYRNFNWSWMKWLAFYGAPDLEHVTPILQELHWFLVPFRAQFKVLVLTYTSLYGWAGTLVSEGLPPSSTDNLLGLYVHEERPFSRFHLCWRPVRAFSVVVPYSCGTPLQWNFSWPCICMSFGWCFLEIFWDEPMLMFYLTLCCVALIPSGCFSCAFKLLWVEFFSQKSDI